MQEIKENNTYIGKVLEDYRNNKVSKAKAIIAIHNILREQDQRIDRFFKVNTLVARKQEEDKGSTNNTRSNNYKDLLLLNTKD